MMRSLDDWALSQMSIRWSEVSAYVDNGLGNPESEGNRNPVLRVAYSKFSPFADAAGVAGVEVLRNPLAPSLAIVQEPHIVKQFKGPRLRAFIAAAGFGDRLT